jgi:hypothetical protein
MVTDSASAILLQQCMVTDPVASINHYPLLLSRRLVDCFKVQPPAHHDESKVCRHVNPAVNTISLRWIAIFIPGSIQQLRQSRSEVLRGAVADREPRVRSQTLTCVQLLMNANNGLNH